MKASKKIKLGHLAALLCAFIWGITFICSKILMRELTPLELLVYRFVIGYVVLWVISPRKLTLLNKKHEYYFMAAGGLGVVVYFLSENTALTYTLASNVSIIVSIAPFFTALLANYIFEDEHLKTNFLIGFFCAIVGIVLVTFNGSVKLKLNPAGDFLSLLSAVVWAIYSVLVRKIGQYRYPIIMATRRIFFYGLLFMLPLMPFMGFRFKFAFLANPVYSLNLLFLGVLACALCYCIWNYAVDVLGAVKTSNYIYAIPVITMAASALTLKEPVTLMGIAGMALTIIGLIVSGRR